MMSKSMTLFDHLDRLTEEKYLRKVISPCGKLCLWNYTDKTTYEKKWNKYTLNARGTVYEIETQKVVARAFSKFFNFGELQPVKQKTILKSKNFECFEKLDGSLGIVYYYGGEWKVNTRGSFTSDQSIKGKEMLDRKYCPQFLDKTITYLVEIIYPENKIIVNYKNREELVELAVYKESIELSQNIEYSTEFSSAPSSKFDTIEELQEHMLTLDHQEEGYVVRLENGDRVKFKSAEYMRVARLTSCMTPLAFWKAMDNGKVKVDYLEHLPEEFRKEADQLVKTLQYEYKECRDNIQYIFNGMMNTIDRGGENMDIRKKIGLFCKDKYIDSGSMFAMLDEKNDVLNKIIMKLIRPKGNVL